MFHTRTPSPYGVKVANEVPGVCSCYESAVGADGDRLDAGTPESALKFTHDRSRDRVDDSRPFSAYQQLAVGEECEAPRTIPSTDETVGTHREVQSLFGLSQNVTVVCARGIDRLEREEDRQFGIDISVVPRSIRQLARTCLPLVGGGVSTAIESEDGQRTYDEHRYQCRSHEPPKAMNGSPLDEQLVVASVLLDRLLDVAMGGARRDQLTLCGGEVDRTVIGPVFILFEARPDKQVVRVSPGRLPLDNLRREDSVQAEIVPGFIDPRPQSRPLPE